MSVPNQTPYIIYIANGLTTVFPFEFYIISASDIQVSLNGEPVTSGYTVSGVGNISGGDLTFLTPPASGTVVMLERVVPTYRLTDYQDNGDLLADTVNKDFDRLWMAIQRYAIHLGLALTRPLFGGPFDAEGYRISGIADPENPQDAASKNYVDNISLVKALRVPESFVSVIPPVALRANKLLGFNAEGQPVVVVPPSGSASDVMIELAKLTGAGLIGFSDELEYAPGTVGHALRYFTATGADNEYSREDRARWEMSALEFSTPLTDIGDSINKALDSVESEANPSASVNTRGGTVHLTRGIYPAVSTININRGSSGVSGKSIKGDGQSTTELNFSGAPALSDGIAGNDTGPAYGEISNLKVKSAPRRAFSFAKYSRMTFDNIQAESSGADGFYGGIGFVCNFNKITAALNAANGVRFDPTLQHTSHVLNGGYASNNNASGWLHGWMNYSVANGLAADNNALYGHLLEKTSGYILNGCGAESNGRSGFAAIASAAVGEVVATTINNAFAYANNAANSGYANLLHATSTDGTRCVLRLQDSVSAPSGAGAGTKDIIVDGIGAIVKSRGNITPNGVETRNGGYIIHGQETHYAPSIAIPASTATPVCNMRSTQGHRVRYGGEVTVMASNQPPSTPERNTTLYKLLVNKSIGGGSQVLELGKLGHVSGGGASLPSFTWTLVGDQLVATPMTGVGGTNFWFEIDCVGQIVAYT